MLEVSSPNSFRKFVNFNSRHGLRHAVTSAAGSTWQNSASSSPCLSSRAVRRTFKDCSTAAYARCAPRSGS